MPLVEVNSKGQRKRTLTAMGQLTFFRTSIRRRFTVLLLEALSDWNDLGRAIQHTEPVPEIRPSSPDFHRVKASF